MVYALTACIPYGVYDEITKLAYERNAPQNFDSQFWIIASEQQSAFKNLRTVPCQNQNAVLQIANICSRTEYKLLRT